LTENQRRMMRMMKMKMRMRMMCQKLWLLVCDSHLSDWEADYWLNGVDFEES